MTFRCHSKIIVKEKRQEPCQPRMSQKAVNRWFLAVTFLRNPSFIKYRRQGRRFTAAVVTLGSVNFDVPV